MNDPQHEETFADTERKLREIITTLRAQLAAETDRANRAEAERAAQIEADAWRPIETAPSQDGALHVRGVWVHSAMTGKKMYFDACAGYLESGDFLSADGEDHGWRPEDYTHWMPLPEPLEAASRAIRAQPHDRTALDRMLAEAREKALRRAALVCAEYPVPIGCTKAAIELQSAILALIAQEGGE